MYSNITDDFLILDDTLLLYKGHARQLIVPSVCGDHRIETIGSGAVSEKKSLEDITLSYGIKNLERSSIAHMDGLKNITLPETLERIDPNAFYGLKGLESINLILNLNRTQYMTLLAASVSDNTGNRVVAGGLQQFKGACLFADGFHIENFFFLMPARSVDISMRRIFIETVDAKGNAVYSRTLNLMGGDPGMSEQDDIQDKIKALSEGSYRDYFDKTSEMASVAFEKSGKTYNPQPIYIPCFNEREVAEQGNTYRGRLSFIVGRAWFYSVKKLAYDGNIFYCAEKCILTGEKENPYVRCAPSYYYYHDGEMIVGREDFKRLLRHKLLFLDMI